MLALATALATPVFAADANSGGEVIVTGTRTTGMKAADSAAPIEIVGREALVHTGAPDLADALASAIPSLNVQGYGSDTAALTIQAQLRGLSPNDTLVLVNGKRRHTTANLNVDGGSSYSGSSTVDLSMIPVDSIDHVEVLQDGAAAQYGSDAIAGVVNIILKNADHGGLMSATSGQYYNSQGLTNQLSFNRGFTLGEHGYLDVTLQVRTHEDTVLGIGGRSYSQPNGQPLPAALLSGNPVIAAQEYAGVLASGPHFNKVDGDPQYKIYTTMFNAGYEAGGVEFYAFGNYGRRDASHYENYRGAQKAAGPNSLAVEQFGLPNGFDPSEQFIETDYSGTVGAKGEVLDWKWDLSTTYGSDKADVSTINSANDELWKLLQLQQPGLVSPQRNFYDGAYVNTDSATTLDLDREFNIGLAGPLNVALGAEYQHAHYEIDAGNPDSYYGAGAQSFFGYTPSMAGKYNRSNTAVYADLSVKPVTNLLVDLAGRYEHYSDFGGTTVGKLTTRYDFTPEFAVRGTISSGFRAPTLAEEFYSGANVSPTSYELQLAPNSALAVATGFKPLKPERSDSYSIGFVAHPIPKLQITADLYEIVMSDRILTTGNIYATEGAATVSPAAVTALTNSGYTIDPSASYTAIAAFNNGASTRTTGAEITANYASDFGDYGHVDWTAAFNYNETTILKLSKLPLQVQNSAYSQVNLLNQTSISALTTATPKEKVILDADWKLGRFGVNLRETIYGESSEWVSSNSSYVGPQAMDQKIGVTGITDLDVSFKITEKLKIDGGANNLFNTKPPTTPNYTGGNGYPRPVGGGQVFGVPYLFAPWGVNGGYYYARVTYNF